jgi:hypothetical protein
MYHQFDSSKILSSIHTLCLCVFVWFSDKIAIISVYSINLLVSVAETVFTARYELGV